MALQSVKKISLLLGHCVPSVKSQASKIRIKRLELDTNLLMYFRKDDYIYAYDPNKICKTGDIVLVELLAEKLTPLITHKVKEVVYRLGDITDPLTGKKVVVDKFRHQIDAIDDVFGPSPSKFNYDKAPERGWLEDKKDFTHVETYIKYHETGEEQPYAV
ncbi:28S ribosomal protein S17, mitochondrial [Agrilus planipennis]|uniref:28S ribosomal protein S17, mitochondrial n=1 Tax=Agrilus planipennis TaxID=224129 RepID=A0A1W4XAQ9_AGRPL|nr:28S ribosomal protein S17, mitochondrial [Agrilus planipennis]